jgi:hypothetical protein
LPDFGLAEHAGRAVKGLSQRGYAKHRGVTLRAVQKAIRDGRITLDKDGIDPARADRQWRNNTDETKPRNSVSGRPGGRIQKAPKLLPARTSGDLQGTQGLPEHVPSGYALARERREQLRLKLDQLEFDERMLLLVDAAEFRAKFLPMIADAKTRLLGVASKCKSRLPGLSAVDVSIIEDLIREALGEITNRI